MESNLYKREFELFKKLFKKTKFKFSDLKLEFLFESSKDWSIFFTLDNFKKFYNIRKKKENSIIKTIPLNDLKEWYVDKKTGNIIHKSNHFYKIEGIKVITNKREIKKSGWDQPIITQVGFDGGILGLLRARFSGIPHYLCNLKVEPGNITVLLHVVLRFSGSLISAMLKLRGIETSSFKSICSLLI